MQTGEPTATTVSRSWSAATPTVSVVIATHNRADYLAGLLAALSEQADPPAFEVVIADDGSTDETWPRLEALAASTDLALKALRLAACGGPSVPRNSCVVASRGTVLALTDDDCLPAPDWLAELTATARAGHMVQGATHPAAAGRIGAWDRTISVTSPTGLWESCNVALPRALFDAAGGFPVLDLLPVNGRGFGDDAALGTAAASIAGGRWLPGAVVRHRWLPATYRDHLDAMRRLEAMPSLVGLLPELRDQCYARVFRSRRSAACDAAVAAVGVALAVRRTTPLLATIPWLLLATRAARSRCGRPLPVRAGQEATADLVGLAALIKGSIRSRTLLL